MKDKKERRKNAEGDTTKQKSLESTRDCETYTETLHTQKHTRGQDGGTQITKAHMQVNKSRNEGWCSERGKNLEA